MRPPSAYRGRRCRRRRCGRRRCGRRRCRRRRCGRRRCGRRRCGRRRCGRRRCGRRRCGRRRCGRRRCGRRRCGRRRCGRRRCGRRRRGRAGWPGHPEGRPSSAAGRGAWRRPVRGIPRRDLGHRTGPGRGPGRSGRSRRPGWPPRSSGSSARPARTIRHRTVPWPAPRGPSATRARRPRRVPEAARPPPGCACRAARSHAGTRHRRRPQAAFCLPGRKHALRPGRCPRVALDLPAGNLDHRTDLLSCVQTFQSGRTAVLRDQTALVLEPFRGVRYSPGRVSGLAEVTSPPYDVIGDAAATRLLAADSHNVVQLIVPQTGGKRSEGSYGDAAGTLRRWLAEGVLVPDPEPALYVYEQSDAAGNVLQRGLIGALSLSPPGAGVVLPHEDVMPGPVRGRLQLMTATRANLEPIFLLTDGTPGAAARLVDQVAMERAPLLDVVTEDGLAHRMWAVTDPAELAAVAADLAPRHALIADGHHRYAAYLELQARMRASGAGAGPWDQGLALLVDSTVYPPRINPIHRVIPGLRPADAVAAARAGFRVREIDGELAAGLAALRDAGAAGAAFLVGGDGTLNLLTGPDPGQVAAAMPAGRSPHWRGLPASILQEFLLERLWGIRDDEAAVRVVHDNAATALRAAGETGGTAVICNPVSAQDVQAVAADGERVPRKSTSFGPKPRTGLVMRTFDAD